MLITKNRFYFIIVAILSLSACKREAFVMPERGIGSNVSDVDSSLIYGTSVNDSTKVLLIGIGGCSGHAMRVAKAPNIQGLLPHAIYSYDALTEGPALSGPG